MFGCVRATPLFWPDAGKDLEVGASELAAIAEAPRIARWIQFPAAVPLFLLVPHDPESGAIYVYGRRDGVWHGVDFEVHRRFDRNALLEYPRVTLLAPGTGYFEPAMERDEERS